MRTRPHFVLIVLAAALAAFAFAGCGDNSPAKGIAIPTAAAGGVTGATGGSTGASGATSATGATSGGTYSASVELALKRGYQACVASAGKLSDATRRKAMKAQCASSFKSAQAAAKNNVKAMKNAAAQCQQNAKAISNPQVRKQVMENCKNLGK